jgi:hypothetical protein
MALQKDTTQKSPRTKKIAPRKEFTTKTGVILIECYCRKCMKTKIATDFYDSMDVILDSNGKMSVCKDCCNDIYNNIFSNEKSLESSMLKTCRILNARYDEIALQAVKEEIQTIIAKGVDPTNIFGLYKRKLTSTTSGNFVDRITDANMSFVEPTNRLEDNPMLDDDYEDSVDLKMFWGTNFKKEDYDWLEFELSEWKRTHKCDTKAEETLLKEVVFKEFDIRKDRAEGRDPSAKVKQLQEIMKTAAIDPAKTSEAGSGKAQDTFSAFIKTIEENEPAEYYKDKKLFKDFDNVDFYFRKYVTRPLKNFITQSRDFNVTTDDEDDDADIYTEDFHEDGDLK